MSMRSLPAFLVAVFMLGAAAGESPGLGIEADPQAVAAWDSDIGADGTGLPPGSGSAREGEAIYVLHCLACHGAAGSGGLSDVLVGGHGTLDGPAPLRTVGSFWPYATTLFDYVRRAMPYLEPRSLTNDDVYALTAYLLFMNGIIKEDAQMDARTLAEVRMPNRDNFILAFPAAQMERIYPEAPE